MPIVIKNRRSATTGAPWPTDLQPGQVAVNSADRQVAVGDANGPAGAAPAVPVIAIRLFDPSGVYVTDDMVVYDGDIYIANAGHTGAWDAGNFDTLVPPPPTADWPTILEDNRVGYTWSTDEQDGLIINRTTDVRMSFVTNTTAGFQIGDNTDLHRAEITWDAAAHELQLRTFNKRMLAAGDGYVYMGAQVRVPDMAYTQDIGGYRFETATTADAAMHKQSNENRVRFRVYGDNVFAIGPDGMDLQLGSAHDDPQFIVPTGTIDDLSVQWVSDEPDALIKGMYSPGANEFSFVVGGERVYSFNNSDENLLHKDIVVEDGASVHFKTVGDGFIQCYLNATYAALAWDDTAFEYGDLNNDALRFWAKEGEGIAYMRNDNVVLMSMSVHEISSTTTGVVQLLHSIRVGVNDPPNLGTFPEQPKFTHMQSDAGRGYTIAADTEFLVERLGDCYLSVISSAGSSNKRINFGGISEEDAFGTLQPAAGVFSFQAGQEDVLRLTHHEAVASKLEVLGQLFADTFIVSAVPLEVAGLIYELQALDARITAAGG